MATGVTFQTRARTIDHLGRGQIADMPTAITELWKNAYDAVADSVALHIFDGQPEVAAIFDDGCGMSRQDFVERWLVIGTESKIVDQEMPAEEREGFRGRPRQGEKGIGRLSAAFIAPITLVVSRKLGGRFTAALVDWRLFENPFLSLSDIRLPLEEFDSPYDLEALLPGMFSILHENVHGGEDPDRQALLSDAWRRFSEYERTKNLDFTTEATILASGSPLPLTRRHMEEWPTFVGLKEQGTALFMIGIQHNLAVWVRSGGETDDIKSIKDKLRDTLTAFTDPLSDNRVDFDYEVFVHTGDRSTRRISASDVFAIDDFRTLEHQVAGNFDEHGVFTGRIIAFGRDYGIKQIPPREPPPKGKLDRVGRFSFCIGTFEQDSAKTTHSLDRHAFLKQQADTFGGINFYRDGLRVMPYGRPDADFLGIEERRNLHSGRYYWAHRRSFGRIAVTRAENPNLKDKAGREGLVDNRARQVLRNLVINVLVEVAKRYFGTDSDVREEVLPDIIKRNAAARAAAERARTRRRVGLRKFLNERTQPLRAAIAETDCVREELEQVDGPDAVSLVATRLKDLNARKDDLRPPPAPAKPGDLEDKYRRYRDTYRKFLASLDELAKRQAELEASFGAADPAEVVRRNFNRSQSLLASRIDNYLKRLDSRVDAVKVKWRAQADEDRAAFYRTCRPLLDDDPETIGLSRILNLLDVRYRELDDAIATRYEPYLRALEQLEEGIDIDGALTVVEDDRSLLEDRVRDLNAVAQLGITVEIIGHELETLDGEIRRNLMRLPDEVKRFPAFKLAYEAQNALTERLRFLAPMKIAGYRAREAITGAQIADYLVEFFERTFRDDRIVFDATPAFRAITIVDLPSRIYPAFVNLVNNAAYWVTHSADRRITIDYVDGKVVIADTGPGVDPDDVDRLFTLFFTRRREGRGVGLYLAKTNLSVANHRIRYAEPHDPHVAPGANFIIEFRGIADE